MRLNKKKKLLSVNDFIDVKILQGTNNLNQIILHFHFSQSLSSLDQFVEGMICANLKQNVNVFMVLENVLKFDNMIVI